jgi:hypothetical protein
MSIRTPNHPSLAETQFQGLCDEQDVTRNKSSQDRTGWDYLIEFDREIVPHLPHDQQPGPETARVQVKSTRTRSLRTNLKLSNAQRFTNEADVCFVVLFSYPANSRKGRIFARHFHRELMAETLKRARQADHDGETALHRIKIPVTFTRDDDHTDDLLSWMREICFQAPDTYAHSKRLLARSLGYESGIAAVGQLTFSPAHVQQLVDAMVGLAADVPIEHASVRDYRFNIPAGTPLFAGTPSRVEVLANPQPARLVIEGENGAHVEINGEYRSASLPGLPIEMARATFSSPAISATISGTGTCTIAFSMDAGVAYPLTTFREALEFRRAIQSSTTVRFEISGLIPITLNGLAFEENVPEWLPVLHAIAKRLWQVCPPCQNPYLSIEAFGSCWHEAQWFASVLEDGALGLRVTPNDDALARQPIRNFLGYITLHVDGHVFWAICRRPCMSSEWDGADRVFSFGAPVVVESGVFEDTSEIPTLMLIDRMKAIQDRLALGTLTIGDGEITLDQGDKPIMLNA